MATRPSTSPSSWLAAGSLAILTAFVFATLRQYGPESAVRRFHQAILHSDQQALAEVTQQRLDDPDVRLLYSNINGAFSVGARAVWRGLKREPNRVEVEVFYRFPNGNVAPLRLVVRKLRPNGQWLVDADETVRLMTGT